MSRYERFTDRSRNVIALAEDEARRWDHEHLGTEHVLIGLIAEEAGVAACILKRWNVDLTTARDEVERLVQRGISAATRRRLYEVPTFKLLIDHSLEEARNLNHNYVGTEHLLLATLRVKDGVAALALMNLGIDLEELRKDVLNLLGHGG
jgi:ATP-dependent Clp protease ATP-binding subunit ClpC